MNQPPEDELLAYYSQVIAELFQRFNTSAAGNLETIQDEVESIQLEIGEKIDTWMALDEQLEELTQHILTQPGGYPSPQVPTDPKTVATASGNSSPPAGVADQDSLDWVNLSFRKALGLFDLWLFHDAARLFQQILRYEPDNLTAMLFLAASYSADNQVEEAAPYLARLRQSDNRQYQCAAEEISAHAAYHSQRLNDAVQHLLRVIRWLPDSADTWFNLGLCYAKLKDWTASAGALSQAVELDPTDMTSRQLLVDVWLELEEYNVALQHVEAALTLEPGDPQLIQRKGRILKRAGHPEKARQVYLNALAQSPAHWIVLDEYADLCLSLGKLTQAMAATKKLLSIQPQNQTALLKLALLEVLHDAPDKSEQILQQLRPETLQTPYATLCMARIALSRREFLKAASLLGGLHSHANTPWSALTQLYLARSLRHLGKKDEAMAVLRGQRRN